MNKNFEQMLRLVDYVDGLMVVDKNCIIRHYYTAYPALWFVIIDSVLVICDDF